MTPSHEQIAQEAARYQEADDRQEYWMHRLSGLTQEEAHREVLRHWGQEYRSKFQPSYDEDRTPDRHEAYREDPDAPDSTVQYEIMEDLVSRLPQEDRQILLRSNRGDTQQEIAKSLGLSQPGVSYRLTAIHSKLRAAYRIEQNRILPQDLEGHGLTEKQLEYCRALLENGRMPGRHRGHQIVVNASEKLPPRAGQYIRDLLSRGYSTAWARTTNHKPFTNVKRGTSGVQSR